MSIKYSTTGLIHNEPIGIFYIVGVGMVRIKLRTRNRRNQGSMEKVENINYRMAKRINSKSGKNGVFVEPCWIWRKK
jgi:hypothetical protein